jgi:ferredoxin
MKAVEIGENGKPETDSTAHLNPKECLGCGVCVRNCPTGAIKLEPRPDRTLTPIDTAHRTVLMAIETNTLQNLLFDNHVLFSHRAMATVMGVILKLPPIKKALANKQLKSRYLAALIERFGS